MDGEGKENSDMQSTSSSAVSRNMMIRRNEENNSSFANSRDGKQSDHRVVAV